MIGTCGLRSYPDCNTWADRALIARELKKVVAALEDVNLPLGTKADFRDGDPGWTAFFITGVGNNGKTWQTAVGVNVPAKDTGLGS
jgi:hypothetical protein